MQSEIFDNGATQTFSATTFSATEKLSNSSDSSDSDENSSSDERDNVCENPSQFTSTFDNDDSSKLLISDESSNQQPVTNDVTQQITDSTQPVTTGLTLTKTVQLTECEPDPEPELEVEVQEPELEQKTTEKFEIPQPIEMVRQVEELNDLKEMSLNNFESTMDDISDAELESLEQELEDLVATVEQSVEKVPSTEDAVKRLEDSIGNTTEVVQKENEEVVEEVSAVIKVSEAKSTPPTIEPVVESEENKADELMTAEVAGIVEVSQELVEDPSEIQEISVVSEADELRESSVSEAQEAVEPPKESAALVDPDAAVSTSSTDESTSIQNLPSQSNEEFSINESNSTGSLTSAPDLGRVPPYWIPDDMTNQCMQCVSKFSLIKRRHHCRACGLLLCSNCCSEKFHLHYLGTEGRICKSCHEQLVKVQQQQQNQPRNPNPANPMEYCSTLPPQQQVIAGSVSPAVVMVPSGVLKRGPRSSERKSVIFSDGIRPGTDLEETSTGSPGRVVPEKPPKFNMPALNEKTNSFIPENTNDLPPVLLKESDFQFVDNNLALLQRLRQEELKFAINKNFHITVKIVTRELLNWVKSLHLLIFLVLSLSDLLHQQDRYKLFNLWSDRRSSR